MFRGDVLGRDLMSEVNDHRLRIYCQNRALNCAHKIVGRAEISEQSNGDLHRTLVSADVRIFIC